MRQILNFDVDFTMKPQEYIILPVLYFTKNKVWDIEKIFPFQSQLYVLSDSENSSKVNVYVNKRVQSSQRLSAFRIRRTMGAISLSVNTLIDAVWQIEVTSKWAIIWLRQLRLWSLRKRLYDDELIHDDQVTSKDSLLLDGRREYCIGNSPRRPLEEQLNKKQLLRRGNGPPQDLTACRGNRDVDLNWESVIWLRWLT